MATPGERAAEAREEAREIAASDCWRCWTGEPHDHDYESEDES